MGGQGLERYLVLLYLFAVQGGCTFWLLITPIKQESYALTSEGSIILADLFQSDEYPSSSCLPEIEGESLGRDQL
jgi:hypothetical protein